MKKIYILAIAALATINVSAQCNGRYQTDIFTTIDVTTVQYGSNQDLGGNTVNLMMDVYQPQGDIETNRPLVIIAHGGSFSAGTKNNADVVFMATELAKKGYVCASINYRLAANAFSLIAEETTVKVVINAVQDGKAAVRFFRKDAATTDTYKIDPDQVFFGGSSAGGILGINLAYLENLSDLPATWQTWVTQIGGLEGASGNPGFCSMVDGTFGFAGAVVDTSWLDATDVPWYGSHALTDNTVQYGFGQPLAGFTPISVYGGGTLNSRLNTVGVYHHFDSYTGGAHPPYNGSAQILSDNKDSLAMFLFNILDCNPNNLQLPNQKSCANATAVAELEKTIDATIYPNPFSGELNIALTNNIKSGTISITNAVGKLVLTQQVNSYINKIDLNHLPVGMYFVKISTELGATTQKIIKR